MQVTWSCTQHWYILPLWTRQQKPIWWIHVTHQEKPTRFIQQIHPQSIWKNQTYHVICIQSRNRSTVLWMQKRHPPPKHPWGIGTLPRWYNISNHQQLHWTWPYPRKNGIQIIKLQWHAFMMVKISRNITTIQFPMGKCIHQPCRLPNQTPRPSKSHKHALTTCSTKKTNQCTHPMRKIYIPDDISTMWNVRPFIFFIIFFSHLDNFFTTMFLC